MARKPLKSYWIDDVQYAHCKKCGEDTARKKLKGRQKTGTCQECHRKGLAEHHRRPEVKAAQSAYRAEYLARPEVKKRNTEYMTTYSPAYQAKNYPKFKEELDAFRRLLLWSMGVRDFDQEYEFHHVVAQAVTGTECISTILHKGKNFWMQAWTEAHTLCVVMTKEEHNEYHKNHIMQEDGTFVVCS